MQASSGSQEHGAVAAARGGIAEIGVIGQGMETVEESKAATVTELDDAGLAGEQGNVGKTLVIENGLFAKMEDGAAAGNDEAFDQ